jgi:hypothetical protein
MGGRAKDGRLGRGAKKHQKELENKYKVASKDALKLKRHETPETVFKKAVKELAITKTFLDAQYLKHIVDGEPGGKKGGHRFGAGNMGKTEFPSTWTDLDIAKAVLETERNPDKVADRSSVRKYWKEINGVIVEMKIFTTGDGDRFCSAFPRCGNGVIRNIENGTVQVPLDRKILEGKGD